MCFTEILLLFTCSVFLSLIYSFLCIVCTLRTQCFPAGSGGKESACNIGDLGLIPGLGSRPGEENGYPLQFSCLENPIDRYSPWGGREWDMTERLTLSLSYHLSF